MRWRLVIALLFVILGSNLSLIAIPAKAGVEDVIKNKLEATASVIVVGITAAPRYDFSYENGIAIMPYTFMDVDLEITEKTSINLTPTITIYYEGGIVNNELCVACRNPWGEILLNSNEKLKLYLVKGDTYPQYFYVIGYDILKSDFEDSSILSSPPSSYYMYEEYGAGFKWDGYYYTNYANIGYYFCTYGVPSYLQDQNWRGEMQTAYSTWTSDAYSNIVFNRLTPDRTVLVVGNGINEIMFNNLESGTLAATTRRPIGAYEFNEWDTQLNTDYTWSIGGVSGQYDIRNLVTHEAGHAVGLRDMYSDTYSTTLTMYWWIDDGETLKRSLASGDKAGAQFVCPKNAKPTVTTSSPYDYQQLPAYTPALIQAGVTVSQGTISQVQYKVTKTDYSVEYSWTTMTYSSGVATGSWTPTTHEGYYYITVRAKSSYNIYGYDTVIVYCPGPIL